MGRLFNHDYAFKIGLYGFSRRISLRFVSFELIEWLEGAGNL